MAVRLTRHSGASRPIRQSSYVARQARAVRQNLRKWGAPLVTEDFLVWLNGQLHKQGKSQIVLDD